MKFFDKKISKKITGIFIIYFLGFLSFANNSLNIANDKWYNIYSADTEKLVVDGLIRGKDENNKLRLGRFYTEEKNEKLFNFNNKENYNSKIKGDKFVFYNQQFGFQLYFFYILEKVGFSNYQSLKKINILVFTSCLSLIFLILTRNFSIIPSLLFSLTFIISPWIVVAAQNFYWLIFTWLLPFMVTLYFFSKNMTNLNYLLFFILLTFSYIIKMLCGYEYISMIGILSITPFFLMFYLKKIKFNNILKNIFLCFFSFIFAFIISISLHAFHIKSSKENFFDSVNKILVTAKTRTSNAKEIEINEYCKNKFYSIKEKELLVIECKNQFIEKKNTFKVILRYLLIKDFLPFFDNTFNIPSFQEFSSNPKYEEDKNILKNAFNKLSIKKFFTEFNELKLNTKKIFFSLIINFLVFIFVIIFSFINTNLRGKILILLSASATLSWHILATDHSYFHFHYNYILWYFPLIPISLFLLFNKKKQ